MPAPALTLAPLTNPLPSIVTATVAPVVPWLGVTALTVTALLVTVVTAWADDPSENVAVTVSVVPHANPLPPSYADPNTDRLPPTATDAYTAITVALFSSTPSSE